jgi:pantetheine-phosphate adenylyltransferase
MLPSKGNCPEESTIGFVKPAKTVAVYGGSFDPITKGHVDIIIKAAQTFDEVIVAIGSNPKKTRCFPVDQSMELIKSSLMEILPLKEYNWGGPNIPYELSDFGISVDEFTGGGLVAFARSKGASHLVRGLRQASDFNDEFSLHGVIEQIAPELGMVHFIGEAKYLHVSSSTAKELASLNEALSWVVGPSVEKALRERFKNPS